MRSTSVVAFLRGVNLGSRQMKMAELKACCEALGLRQVKTILASGNVRFEAAGIRGLKDRLERALAAQFGYPVQVVLRTASEIDAMIASDPFGAVDSSADVARHVLLSETPIEPMPDLSALPSHIDVPRVDRREIDLVAHRLPNGRYTEGLDRLGSRLPKGLLVTMRNWNTILKTVR